MQAANSQSGKTSNLVQAARRLLRQPPRSVVRFAPRIVELLLVAGIAWFAATIVIGLISPPPSAQGGGQSDSRGSAPLTADMAVFSRFDPFAARPVDASPAQIQEARETTLDITMHGVWAEADGDGIAILKTGNTEQRMYQVGETIVDGVVLASVAPEQAIIRRDGRLESVPLQNRLRSSQSQQRGQPAAAEPSSAGVPQGTGTPTTSPDLSAGLSATGLSEIVAVRPVLEGSDIVAFEVLPRGDSGAFERLGLVSGDRIMRINGQQVAADMTVLASRLREIDTDQPVVLTVDRSGQAVDVTLNLSDLP